MKPDPHPAAGGSYIRDADGNLLKTGTDKAAPDPKKKQPKAPKNAPVKEA